MDQWEQGRKKYKKIEYALIVSKSILYNLWEKEKLVNPLNSYKNNNNNNNKKRLSLLRERQYNMYII